MENYFNYFTEIEEGFRRCRGTPTLLSTLDWALIESWKEAGIPLQAVLAGIAQSFEKYARRPQPFRKVNGLAYCVQEVLAAAQKMTTAQVEGGTDPRNDPAAKFPFTSDEILEYIERNALAVERAAGQAREGCQPVLADDLAAAALDLRQLMARASENAGANFVELERRLTALEEKITASLMRASSLELVAQFRLEVERGLVGSRRQMTAEQIESLERNFLKKRLYEHHQIPRLSLFYL